MQDILVFLSENIQGFGGLLKKMKWKKKITNVTKDKNTSALTMKLSYSMPHQCQIQYTAGQQGVHGGYVVVQYPGQTLFPQPLQPFPAPHTMSRSCAMT